MKIHYIQPYRPDKNIGLAINNAITQLNAPDTDWIVLLDHDILFLRPDSKAQLEQILNTTTYDILGPITNRLSASTQLAKGVFDETDIIKHIHVANRFHELNYGQTQQTISILAALCLCFKVSTWRSLAGFQPGVLTFDSLFCMAAIKKGYKLAIMTGIYVFHLYRLTSSNPRADISHLITSVSDTPKSS